RSALGEHGFALLVVEPSGQLVGDHRRGFHVGFPYWQGWPTNRCRTWCASAIFGDAVPASPHPAARNASSPGYAQLPGFSSSRCAECIVAGLRPIARLLLIPLRGMHRRRATLTSYDQRSAHRLHDVMVWLLPSAQ